MLKMELLLSWAAQLETDLRVKQLSSNSV